MPDATTHGRGGAFALGALVVGLGLGAVAGWVLRGPGARPATTAPAARERPDLLPRRSLAEQHTVLVGERAAPPEERDGRLILRPSGMQRVLTFEAEDVDAARAAVEAFVAGLKPDLVTERAPERVTVRGVRVHWRVEGEGRERLLRVVAVPVDPYGSESRAARTAEAIAEWCIVNGVTSRTVSSFEAQAAAVTRVRAPGVRGKMPVFDAAEEVFRARGLRLAPEEVVQGAVVEVVRDTDGTLLWSFSWSEDQQHGTFGVYHHAEPFDTAGEQEMLLAVLRRALGREVEILLEPFR